nr:hypothetical protein [uncultured Pseudomonas sp.]
MANPTLTPFPTPPLPEQDEVTFNRNAANSLLAQANFVGEANTVVTWMGQQIDAAAASKKAAADSAAAAAQSANDAATTGAAQVKLATDQAVASKGSADAAARQLSSTETVAAAVRAQINLPSLVGKAGQYWRVSADEKTLELVPLVVNQVGDTVISTQAPDSAWANTGTVYFQAQYPKLFAKLGKLPDWRLDQAGLTTAAPGSQNLWSSGTYGNGKFVFACQDQSQNNHKFMVTSDFGATWQAVINPANTYAYGLVWDGARFVAILSGSYSVLTSTDGVTWSQSASVLPTNAGGGWSHLAYGNGVYIAGVSGDGRMARNAGNPTSSWSLMTMPDSFNVTKVFFVLGQFVAACQGSTTYYTSADGLNWVKRTSPLAYSGIIAGNDSSAVWANGNNIWVTNDLITWTFSTTLSGAALLSISAGPGCFIAQQNANGVVSVSADGVRWFAKQMPWNINFNGSFYYGNSYFLAPRYNDVNVFKARAFSYSLANQFYTTDTAPVASGLTQYIKAS